jgi:hypothetical protein
VARSRASQADQTVCAWHNPNGSQHPMQIAGAVAVPPHPPPRSAPAFLPCTDIALGNCCTELAVVIAACPPYAPLPRLQAGADRADRARLRLQARSAGGDLRAPGLDAAGSTTLRRDFGDDTGDSGRRRRGHHRARQKLVPGGERAPLQQAGARPDSSQGSPTLKETHSIRPRAQVRGWRPQTPFPAFSPRLAAAAMRSGALSALLLARAQYSRTT